MDEAIAEIWRAHIAGCASCTRYDRVLRRGLKTLAAQALIEPDINFTSDLHRRLAFEDHRLGDRPITSMAAASVTVAAMLAFAAWLPVMMLTNPPKNKAVASASASQVASEIAWHVESAVETSAGSHIHQAKRVIWPANSDHVIEAKYSPVILESPIAPLSYARTVSYGGE